MDPAIAQIKKGSPPHLAPPVNPNPCTLHPTPYTLHPTPYALHPAHYTLHPTPYTISRLRAACSRSWSPPIYALNPNDLTLKPYLIYPAP